MDKSLRIKQHFYFSRQDMPSFLKKEQLSARQAASSLVNSYNFKFISEQSLFDNTNLHLNSFICRAEE